MVFKSKEAYLSYVKNFIFGVEDSLVSTVGLLSGVAAAQVSRDTIVLTGVILIFVEAFSMGVGSYLSEQSTSHLQDNSSMHQRTSIIGGIIMLVSYFASGLIPLFPYFIMDRPLAFWFSIGFSLTSLFILGVFSAKLLKSKILNSAFRMLILGGIAIAIGVVVGQWLERYQ